MLSESPKEGGPSRGTAEHGALPRFPGVHVCLFHILSFSISFGEGSVALKDSRGSRGTEEALKGTRMSFFVLINKY